MSYSKQNKATKGVALLSAIMVILLLSVIALTGIGLARSSNQYIDSQIHYAMETEILQAGINKAIYDLVNISSSNFRIDNYSEFFLFYGREIELKVTNESGKFDINFASKESLEQLFGAVGVSRRKSISLAETIIKNRENATNRKNEHKKTFLPYLPKFFFEKKEELQLVEGITENLYCKISGAITIYSQSPNVDHSLLPDLVKRRLEKSVNAYSQTNKFTDPSSVSAGQLFMDGQAFTIEASFVREADKETNSLTKIEVVRIVSGLQKPFWILSDSTKFTASSCN